MDHSFDLEIFRRLKEGTSATQIAEELAFGFSKADFEWSAENLNTFYAFLLKSGQNDLLIRFCLEHSSQNKHLPFPWGHFLEALYQAGSDIDEKLQSLLKKTLKTSRFQYEASRCSRWDALLTDIAEWRSQKRWELGKNGPLLRKDLLDQLLTLRAQQLIDAENRLLQRLKKMFPQDPEIEKEAQITQERRAYEVLSKYEGLQTLQMNEAHNLGASAEENVFLNSLYRIQATNPSSTMDLAIGCWMMEDYEGARLLLEKHFEDNESYHWFRMEVWLKTRHYLEILEALPALEVRWSNEPETFFATALLRAQSYWGLGQKNKAIEILESLIASRPHYRSAPLLLNQWRGL